MTETLGPRVQLWAEEVGIVSALAAAVPAGGTIVEIGTADGGTAALMHRAAAGRDVRIFTVDPSPSPLAVAYHQGTGVHVVQQPSEAFAREYAASFRRPIDFLFIDGNHDLEHVVGDWNVWAPQVPAGGVVAFHDYDPPERGGLVHLAVRVAGETIARSGRLAGVEHRFKILSGRVPASGATRVSAADCRATLGRIASGITASRAAVAAGARVRSDEATRALLAACSGAAPAGASNGAIAVVPRDGTGEAARAGEGALVVDSLALCYLVADGLRSHYAALAASTRAHKEFIFWAEMLQMLDHGCGGLTFPDGLPGEGATMRELSAFIAREQVRVLLLARVVGTFVEWQP